MRISPILSVFALALLVLSVNASNRGAQEEDVFRPIGVTMWVMSKCPDAVSIENFFAPIFSEFGPKYLSPELKFIVNDDKGVISSMHGPTELEGDKYQTCVQTHVGNTEQFMFALCMDQNYTSIPANVPGCLAYAVPNANSRALVEECVQKEAITELQLQYGVARLLGVKWSPTIYVDGVRVCLWHEKDRCPIGTTKAEWTEYICNLIEKKGGELPQPCH
ncbi:Gamma interferon inducible lysosomal thiol reductase GILT [Carpediemonas membranifera]|uniref:Gamma interferon inducible lysosomal thiol reductase GILT n=1 Tax=Carpediemonas membranifera TaxID=201153 RepID=A0A8J6AVF2_9EUKA|nr:Gamma interferon inducible lysosomal thiol reductase GILT [Carpediemonas membranifera]|eukprot:KAG9395776.1 Gamma interferon inducible lysosomal thiol reductase GILT [Carpediemonas membranifera]